MKVLLAGEGPDDIGDWYKEAPHRPTEPADFQVGVVEALLRRVAPTSWVVEEGVRWTKIRKYKAGDHRGAETRNILGLALLADDTYRDAVVFTRDRDGDEERERDILAGLEEARRRFAPRIFGGVAVEEIEAWILALLAENRSESRADAKGRLSEVHQFAGREQMVSVVEQANLDSLPADAHSLRAWLDQIRENANSLEP